MNGKKKLVIIGSGMGGLAAGIYGRINDYDTDIFEMHKLPGGQCTAYKRKGYTFDVCIHHLFGCAEGTALYNLWKELGAMPRNIILPDDCTSVVSSDGKLFSDYFDPSKLRSHMIELSPSDRKTIDSYVRACERFSKRDITGDMIMEGFKGMLKHIPFMLPILHLFPLTLEKYGSRFSDSFLQRAFGKLVYSLPNTPLIVHLARKGKGLTGGIGWPAGGSSEFAKSIEEKYRSLGGKIHYSSRVEKIIVSDNKACGVRLQDGTEVNADIVISNADGRKTITEMLENRFTNPEIRKWLEPPDDETNWGVQVFLGVNRDLSAEPSAKVLLFEKPQLIAGVEHDSIEIQMYGHDPSMAPPGKGVMKVELISKYSYWNDIAQDRNRYKEEKQQIAEQVIDIFEGHFPGIRGQIEAADVPTFLSWERYMGGTQGFNNMPKRDFSILGSLSTSGMKTTLPGLENFYFAGVWATMAGALFMNALSGKLVIEEICQEDGKRFLSEAAAQ